MARESEDHGREVARKEEQERTCPASKIRSSRGREGNWKPQDNSLLESQPASHQGEGEKEKDKCLDQTQDNDKRRAPEGTLER